MSAPNTRRIILVGCGKTKTSEERAARELYTGNLFRAAREYAETEVAAGRAAGWAILSGKHRLVKPDDVHAMTPGAEAVELVVLAGAAYSRLSAPSESARRPPSATCNSTSSSASRGVPQPRRRPPRRQRRKACRWSPKAEGWQREQLDLFQRSLAEVRL
jgi:hypothetical protein